MEFHIERITINADTCHGKSTIRNMCYPVDQILDLLSSGKWVEIKLLPFGMIIEKMKKCIKIEH